jgi:predicted  nucleic acid-binding Zn-ribbon protein
MNKTLKTLLAVVPFLLTAACTDPAKAPAQAAIQAGEAAVATLTDEVAKYAPDQVKAVKDALAKAKASAAAEKWNDALGAAKELPAAASKAVADAQAKKAELEKAAAEKAAQLKQAYEEAQAQLPGKIEELKKQVAALSKSKKLPKGVTKDAVAQAKAAVADLDAGAGKLADQAKTDMAAAAEGAKALLTKATEAVASLGKK